MTRRNKYSNQKVVVDGITFDSKAEAKRYGELKLLKRGGFINDLELQPSFALRGQRGNVVCKYLADFQYSEDGKRVVEDVKSPSTAKNRAYRIKYKLFKDNFGFSITEVSA